LSDLPGVSSLALLKAYFLKSAFNSPIQPMRSGIRGGGHGNYRKQEKGMSEEATAAMANLELCRELYTEDQRRQFYSDYHGARYAEAASNDAYIEHANRRGWKLWPSAGWREKNQQLVTSCRQARMTVKAMEQGHPLLVKVYLHKAYPI
jgi:hypothetical protein